MNRLISAPACRAIAIVLLVCALAVRVLVPSGYMLSPTDHGGLPTIMICSGAGPVQMAMPAAMAMAMPGHDIGKTDSQHENKATDHPCAFAAASAAVDLAALVHPVAAVAATVQPSDLLRLFVRPGLGLAAPPPPKTGPPFLR